ncbi:MAG TPA: alcohol dehydrogenase catalytic domain-containing protein [Vicinamibacterales bacterium]|nr:alcohol dehydrogenase catalytic domain-containing protein [Vicinamibacterales bacterium]
MSRRAVIRRGAAAVAGGAAALAGGQSIAGQAPAITAGTQTGRSFRGFVRHGTGASVETMRLRAIDPRQVVVRSLATAPCYTSTRAALGTNNTQRATIPNHAGFGVVEAIGPLVKRVQVGDRVIVAGTSQCGQCYQCLHGRPDYCQYTFGGDAFPAFADMADGTPVYAEAGIGSFSEIMAIFEEYCVPVFSDLPAQELTLLGDQLASGFAAGHSLMRFEAGSDVCVFGCGPVGVGAIQAGRVAGATQVIAIDPVKYRREFALKIGATTVLDPNAEGDAIVEKIRELTKGPTNRKFAGGMYWGGGIDAMARGADFTVEAAGLQALPPKVETQPDPTNVKTVQQAWDATRMGGHVMLMGLTTATVPFPGVQLAILGRTIHPGQQGGLQVMRDLPRFVKLMERGLLDGKSMITKTYKIEETRQAIQDCADRTVMIGVVLYS